MSWVSDNSDWLHAYMQDLMTALGLSHWTIHLSGSEPDEECAGQIQVVYGRHIATMHLCISDSPEALRNTIVHELLHCHFERMSWAVNNFQEIVGSAAWSVGQGAYVDATEVTIDALSNAIAPMLPLPLHEIRLPKED